MRYDVTFPIFKVQGFYDIIKVEQTQSQQILQLNVKQLTNYTLSQFEKECDIIMHLYMHTNIKWCFKGTIRQWS